MPALQTAQTLVSNRYLAALYAIATERVPEVHRCIGHLMGRADPIKRSPPYRRRRRNRSSGPKLLQAAALLEGDLQRPDRADGWTSDPVLTLAIGEGLGLSSWQVMSAVRPINDLAFQ